MATRTISLRQGDARDISTVEAAMTASFDPRFGEAWTRGQCISVLAMPGVRLTLALVDDHPAGFSMTRTILDEAELLLLCVVPSCRRRGIGAALLRGIISDCAVSGTSALHLEVRAGNDAVKLYRNHQFVKVGERPRYYRGCTGECHDAHTYRRTI